MVGVEIGALVLGSGGQAARVSRQQTQTGTTDQSLAERARQGRDHAGLQRLVEGGVVEVASSPTTSAPTASVATTSVMTTSVMTASYCA